MDTITEQPRPRIRARLTRRTVAATGICTLALTLTVGTASAAPSIPAAASPTSWSSNVCQALNSFQGDIKTLDQNFTKATKTSKSLANIKTRYLAFLQSNVNRTAQLIKALNKAGVPAAPTGAQFAAAIRAGYVDLHDGFNSLVTDAKALPTDTLANFQAAFAVVQTKIQALETRNQAAFSGANQFESQVINDAFAKLAPCKKLNSGS
jgi:hypothetical protein